MEENSYNIYIINIDSVWMSSEARIGLTDKCDKCVVGRER